MDTERAAPVLCAIYGVETIKHAVSMILSVGTGCTSDPSRATQLQYMKVVIAQIKMQYGQDLETIDKIFPVDEVFHL
jgi:hypothetical protein